MKRRQSLSLKLSASIACIVLCVCLFIVFIGYRIFNDQITGYYEKQGEVLISTASEYVDWDKIDYYLGTRNEDEGYLETLETLKMLNKGAGATYLYVLVPSENGAVYVFDTDETEGHCELGYYWEGYEDFIKYADRLKAREPLGPIVSDEEYAWLLSLYLPFYDSDGEFAAYLGVDYSVDHIIKEQWEYMRKLIIATLVLLVVMVFIIVMLFRYMVLVPINKIASAANNFIVDGDGNMEKVNSITCLQIKSDDELQGLAEALKSMENKMQGYIKHLAAAKRKAETDTMTGLLNREAFSNGVDYMLAHRNKHEDYIFIMIDIDYFKSINDRWGHMVGDEVIKAFARVMLNHFGKDNIAARMGGDEFAVFAQGNWTVQRIEQCVESIRNAIHGIHVSKGMKVTASIGVAVSYNGQYQYREFYDKADFALYDAKAAGRDCYSIREMNVNEPIRYGMGWGKAKIMA